MSDFISRQDAIDALHKKRIETMKKGQDVNLIWECLDVVAQVPPADVAPVVHGEWIRDVRTPPFANSKCSNCGKTYGLYPLGYNYCPNCGAKMDL